MSPPSPKATVRRQMIHTRGQLPLAALSDSVCANLAQWPPFQSAARILGYAPLPGELDVMPLAQQPPGHPPWFLPRMQPGDDLLFYPYVPGDVLQTTRWGVAEPVATGTPLAVFDGAVILVPGVCFDRRGFRLGYGKGFYDRFLRRCAGEGVVTVGITAEALLVESLPVEPWDQAVGYVCTERGIRPAGREQN